MRNEQLALVLKSAITLTDLAGSCLRAHGNDAAIWIRSEHTGSEFRVAGQVVREVADAFLARAQVLTAEVARKDEVPS